ncbi:MAG: hydrogenase iron-sulfur subunit [Thermodesulfobacteriota bacterium]|nr:hydrogenase iron-sulfur subunit [Thermodesulfobacteriota bacterium]
MEAKPETEKKEKNWEPKILAFLCRWCSYAGADLTGSSRISYPANVRILRVPCSGRVNPLFILKTLRSGMDGILVSGCHPGDCHYTAGNYNARRKFAILSRLLEYVGIDPRRVQFSWVSASERDKFAKVVSAVVADVKALGPNELFQLPDFGQMTKGPTSPDP